MGLSPCAQGLFVPPLTERRPCRDIARKIRDRGYNLRNSGLFVAPHYPLRRKCLLKPMLHFEVSRTERKVHLDFHEHLPPEHPPRQHAEAHDPDKRKEHRGKLRRTQAGEDVIVEKGLQGNAFGHLDDAQQPRQ